jgi:hypothetical protein
MAKGMLITEYIKLRELADYKWIFIKIRDVFAKNHFL